MYESPLSFKLPLGTVNETIGIPLDESLCLDSGNQN